MQDQQDIIYLPNMVARRSINGCKTLDMGRFRT